jgi:hypothetical protein
VALRHPVEQGLARRLFGATPQGSLALLKRVWARAVGPELASRTEVLAVEGRTLRVRVPDARWRKVLHRMQRDILARMRGLAGDMAPARLGFQEGAVTVTPTATPPTAAPLAMAEAPLPASLATEAASITDEDLRGRFVASAARYLGRFHPTGGQ